MFVVIYIKISIEKPVTRVAVTFRLGLHPTKILNFLKTLTIFHFFRKIVLTCTKFRSPKKLFQTNRTHIFMSRISDKNIKERDVGSPVDFHSAFPFPLHYFNSSV